MVMVRMRLLTVAQGQPSKIWLKCMRVKMGMCRVVWVAMPARSTIMPLPLPLSLPLIVPLQGPSLHTLQINVVIYQIGIRGIQSREPLHLAGALGLALRVASRTLRHPPTTIITYMTPSHVIWIPWLLSSEVWHLSVMCWMFYRREWLVAECVIGHRIAALRSVCVCSLLTLTLTLSVSFRLRTCAVSFCIVMKNKDDTSELKCT